MSLITGSRALFLPLIFAVTSSPALAGDEDMARFRSEYPRAGARLASHYSDIKGVLQAKVKHYQEKKYEGITVEFSRSGTRRKVMLSHAHTDDHTYDEDSIIYCANDDGAFRLSKAKETGKYSITGIGPIDPPRDLFQVQVGRFLDMPYKIEGISLHEVIGTSAVELQSAEPVNFKGKSCIEIKLRHAHSDAPEMVDAVKLIMDPDSAWIIRHCEFVPGGAPSAKATFEIDYGPSQDGIPTLNKVDLINYDAAIGSYVFSELRFEETIDTEFTLTHFGLPEIPYQAAPHQFSDLSNWLLGIAVIGLITAFGVRKLARRS